MTTLSERWSLLDLFEMGEAATALIAAERTGLVAALLAGSGTAGEFAGTTGTDPRAVGLVLDMLSTYQVVTRTGSTYTASSELRELRRSSPGGVHTDLRLLGHVENFLRTGRPLMAMDGSPRERGEQYAAVVPGLGLAYRAVAAELAGQLPADLTDVLDLGAGSGVWGLAVAERSPTVRLTAVDLPPVLAVLEAAVFEAAGLASRVTALAGDYFQVELPPNGFDCVFLGNVLHLERPAGAAALVARAGAALRPGGTLVVIDIMADGEHPTDRERAMYALFLGLRSVHGRMHQRTDLDRWLRDAGLGPARPARLDAKPTLLDILLATREVVTP